jgi:hypothetical protein
MDPAALTTTSGLQYPRLAVKPLAELGRLRWQDKRLRDKAEILLAIDRRHSLDVSYE